MSASVILGLPFVTLLWFIPFPDFWWNPLTWIGTVQEPCSLPVLHPLSEPSFILPFQYSEQSSPPDILWRWWIAVSGDRCASQGFSLWCHDWQYQMPSRDRQRQHKLVCCGYIMCATMSWLWRCRPGIQFLGRIQIGILRRIFYIVLNNILHIKLLKHLAPISNMLNHLH